METIFQVDLGYACFGVVVIDGNVTDAAPIARWMIGKRWAYVQQWIARKRGRIQEGGSA